MHPSIQVEFSGQGDANLPIVMASKIGALSFQLRSFREPLEDAVDEMRKDIREQFDSGGNPPWVPLRDSTVKRKGGDSRPLIRTGNLRRVASQKNAWEISRDEAVYTIPDEAYYGLFHQTGFEISNFNHEEADTSRLMTGKSKSNFVPARPFARISQSTTGKVDEIFDDWVRMRIAKVMLR